MSDSSSNTLATLGTSKGGIRARLKARSSRLISLLGLRSSDTSGPPQPPITEANDRKSLLEKTRFKPKVHLRSQGTGEESIPDSPPHKKQRSPSSHSGLAVRLTARLTLGNPTVIRRTNPQSRLSVRAVSFRGNSAIAASKQEGNTDNSSNPASSQSDGASPAITQSTPPSSNSPVSTRDATEVRGGSQPEWPSPVDLGTAVEAGTGSIRTVELASNAKVFFETYYESLYMNVNPRAQRKQQLEHYLDTMPLSPDEKGTIWRNWTAQEQDCLRQYRLLMARSMHKNARIISAAGFNPVMILGQGSFGVVLLVREVPWLSEASSHDRSSRLTKVRDREGTRCESGKTHRQCMVGRRKDVYAMKVIRKSVMVRNCQEAHLRAERDFLAAASGNSRWIVPLVASFQDAHSLYLVMDYMVGGDFLGLLMRRSILPESVAKHYIAEMVLCVEEAHRLGWIHRDVKPDNFLISETGHLKMSDFGLSFDGHWAHNQAYYKDTRYDLVERLGIQINGDAQDQEEAKKTPKTAAKPAEPDCSSPTSSEGVLDCRDRTHRQRFARSIVGTSQYMAPEVVRGDYYDGRCDYWSLGIILYECLYGRTPFSSKDRAQTKWKIHYHSKTLHFPSRTTSDRLVSTNAVDLINHLLQEKEHRLSCGQYRVTDILSKNKSKTRLPLYNTGGHVYPDDASNIKSHPFFDEIRWDSLSRTSPPFIPKVNGWEDTRYFDDARPFEESDIAKSASPSETSSSDDPAGDDQKRWSRKRARDKILRDPGHGKVALELRKGAFTGYEYRQPKAVEMAFVPERGRAYLPQYGF